ncbi:MAG: hypothetical protein GH149_00260 [Methanosarcinales archaeon]|nr:hypothetical protein [Methanosarcinales archaeon]
MGNSIKSAVLSAARREFHVFGHIFTSFLALYGYCTLETALKEAGLPRKLSPMDLLEEFSKVYIVTDGEQEIISEIPRKVAELDKLLGIDVFPKMMRSYGFEFWYCLGFRN